MKIKKQVIDSDDIVRRVLSKVFPDDPLGTLNFMMNIVCLLKKLYCVQWRKSLDFLFIFCPGNRRCFCPGKKSNFPHYNYIIPFVKCQV